MEATRSRDTVQEQMDRRLRTAYFRGNGEMLLLSPEEVEMFKPSFGQYINGLKETKEKVQDGKRNN